MLASILKTALMPVTEEQDQNPYVLFEDALSDFHGCSELRFWKKRRDVGAAVELSPSRQLIYTYLQCLSKGSVRKCNGGKFMLEKRIRSQFLAQGDQRFPIRS